jgi:hypothetical protein
LLGSRRSTFPICGALQRLGVCHKRTWVCLSGWFRLLGSGRFGMLLPFPIHVAILPQSNTFVKFLPQTTISVVVIEIGRNLPVFQQAIAVNPGYCSYGMYICTNALFRRGAGSKWAGPLLLGRLWMTYRVWSEICCIANRHFQKLGW